MAETLAIDRPQRWDQPFDPDMTDADVDSVLALELFHNIEASQFPKNLSLRDIIRNDVRIQPYRRGDIVVREGDYGNSVFVIVKGTVRAVRGVEDRALGHHVARHRHSFTKALGQLWKNARVPEARNVATYQGGANLSIRDESSSARIFFKDVDSFIAAHNTFPMTEGQVFGEIAALSRSPRTATVFADADLELVELRWQGLRDIRQYDRAFREYIDRRYGQRRWAEDLAETPLFAHLDEKTLEIIASRTLFETHGTFEWWSSYKKVTSRGSEEVLKLEPIVAEQESYADGLIVIRSGFARISERLDHGERTIGYATTRDVFGLAEIVQHWREGTELRLRRSLRAVGYVDVLRVPTALVEKYVLPHAPAHLLPEPSRPDGQEAWEDTDKRTLEQSLIDFFVDTRTINGTAAMFIDTDRCVGCDDCVRACASAHDNNPRFIRHGPSHGNLQVTNACMHCADAVCLIGCPTGAIARNAADGRVMIDDPICIGCGTCANSCPYNNIQLVEIRDQSGAFIVDSDSKQPIVKATKCDLCHGQLGGPACARACPHDALVRMDMRDQSRLVGWVNRS
jgi:Fe-S-cluster-containing dehydrogenase component/CRP-like cAMP-binding protein